MPIQKGMPRMKTEYTCHGCIKKTCTTNPQKCDVDKASVICGCGVKIFYPAASDHPHYCSQCEKTALKKSVQKHKLLESFGV